MATGTRILGGRRERRKASVEMAPLIDMVFILLVFFVVTTTFVKESAVAVERPSSAFAQPVSSGFLAVAIDKLGTVYVSGHAIEPDNHTTLNTLLKSSGHNRIVIQADGDVPTARLLKVLDTCKKTEADHVDVAAVPY